jgi:hypothetical protein
MHEVKILTVFFVVFLIIPLAGAKLIDNPEAVSHMRIKLVKDGVIMIKSQGPLPRVTGMDIYLSMPQNTDRQDYTLQSIEGPDSYFIENDQWDNEIVRLHWDSPEIDEDLYYSTSFEIDVRDAIESAAGKFFGESNVTKGTLEMTEKAYNLASGLDDIGKIFRLTEWVYNWVDYEYEYQGLPKSAQWTFENRRGICSSNSNLLISMLRILGFNAYYAIGYAYTEETPGTYWGPHGWVEVEHDGMTISLDPTWMESPVDSTHIKFANSPGSEYAERAEILGSNVGLVWKERNDPVIEVINVTESERVIINAEFIPNEVGSESHAMLLTEVSNGLSWECVLSYMQVQSCSIDGNYFLEMPVSNKTLAFCGNKTFMWFVKTPELGNNAIYTCPVSVYGPGSINKPEIVARSIPSDVDVAMNTPKVLTPNQVFNVEITLENHGFSRKDLKTYLIFGDDTKNEELELDPGYQAKLTWNLKAPVIPGFVKLQFFSSSGSLIEQDLKVISKRHVKIESVSIPQNMSLGDSVMVNISIRGLEQTRGELQVKIEDQSQTREFYVDQDETKNFVFSYTPGSAGNKEVGVILLSEGVYEDGMIGNLLVVEETGSVESIINAITGFFKWIASLFGM